MAAAVTLKKYISRCEDILNRENIAEAEELQKEIISVFNDIDNIRGGLSNYSPVFAMSFAGNTVVADDKVDFLSDLKLLKNKLQAELEKHEQTEDTAVVVTKIPKILISHASKDNINEITLADTVIKKLPPEIIEGEGQSITEGDTIISLKDDHVGELSAGEHTIDIVTESGTAETTFTVNEKPTEYDGTKSPKTGDNSNISLWLTILFVSGGLMTVKGIYGKKKRSAM